MPRNDQIGMGGQGVASDITGARSKTWVTYPDPNDDRYPKLIYPQHQEDNIDNIVKKYGQGTGYAKWQKERYPVKVDISAIRASAIKNQMNKKFGIIDNKTIDANLVNVFK